MPKTDYFEQEVLKICGGLTPSLSLPITPFIGLFTAAPGETGGGTEVSGGAYARASAVSKLAIVSGQLVNSLGDITWPTPTASWGTPTHWGLFNANTSGYLLRYGPLPSPSLISTGQPVVCATGQLVFAEE